MFFPSKKQKCQLKERKFALLSNDDIQKTCPISKAICLFYVLVLLTTSADTDQDILWDTSPLKVISYATVLWNAAQIVTKTGLST